MLRTWRQLMLVGILTAGALLQPFFSHPALAEEDIDQLTREIEARKSQVGDLSSRMDAYRKKVASYANTSASLENDIELIENQIALTNLDIQSTQKQIEVQQFALQISGQKIQDASTLLEKQRGMMKETVFALNTRDQRVGFLTAVFGSETFDAMFAEVERFERLNEDLHRTLLDTEATKTSLETTREEQSAQLGELQDMQAALAQKSTVLQEQQEGKTSLLTQTEASESKYRVLMSEARAEQQYLSSQIVTLQRQIDSTILLSDTLGDASIITWPVHGAIITARFHDPNYPFRGLFEHSGLDLAIPVGTKVEAAAPGYVGWARQGKGYGNYVMVIHTNGLATLYAHLSRISVTEGQYIGRGEQIGLSGGMPGQPGAGLSTGPHLHFEVRLNGIPVNPENYLTGN